MLRRRIFSGAMASVMALSSVAVVASAEETQVKTKADLEKLVNETYGDEFRTDKLSEYGSVSAEAVLDALEAADAVLYDADADAEDYTVAYMMVEATVARLVIHTAEELQALIDDCTSIYEDNNIMNEELQDLIYTDDTYGVFYDAYEYACGYVSSTSSSDITEAYEKLASAKNGLVKNAIVSKSMFRSIMKQYEAIISAEYDYEDWRRGNLGWATTNTGNFWIYTAGTSVASYGVMWEGVMACKETIKTAYESIDAIKNLSKTTDSDIVSGYKMAQDAVAVFNSWTVDNSTRATKSGVNALLKEYHGCLVYDFAKTTAEEIYNAISTVLDTKKSAADINPTYGESTTFQGNQGATGDWTAVAKKLVDADWVVVPSTNIYVPVNDNGYCEDAAAIDISGTRPDETTLPAWATKWQLISKNSKYDILKLVEVTADKVVTDGTITPNINGALDAGYEWPFLGWAWAITGEDSLQIREEIKGYEDAIIKLSDAYGLAMDYLAATKDEDYKATIINDIDTAGTIANDNATGSSKEWAIVYRYLKYALEDQYSAVVPDNSHTRADVKALIEQAYDLAELTGDAAIFNQTHVDLVTARQTAIDWVKDANSDKMYKDYTTGENADGVTYMTSTDAYDALWKKYEALLNEYNAMKYSFGDIYEKLAEVSEMIDDGELEATTSMLTALDETAYALSVVADEVAVKLDSGDYNQFDENAGFDVDRVLQANNRVITTTDEVAVGATGGKVNCKSAADGGPNVSHYNLWQAYEALLAEIAKQTAPEVLLGDVDANGTVNALDAAALLQAIVADKALDLAVADYDKSGTVNALDASAILIAIVNGTV